MSLGKEENEPDRSIDAEAVVLDITRRLAAEAGVPIVPVTIRGTRSILRPDQWFPRRGTVAVTIGTPAPPEGADWAAAIRLRDAARAEILRHCGEPDLA